VNRERDWELAIGEADLAALTRDLDRAHREALPVMRARAREYSGELADTEPRARHLGRRTFLLGVGGVGTGLALAACSGSSSSDQALGPNGLGGAASASAGGGASGSGSGTYTGELRIVALATALENQAVTAYTAALAAGKQGKLGTVPPAVTDFMQTAMAQHEDHAKAWNAVLTAAGKPPITDVPLSTQPQVLSALGAATSVGTVANLALQLEDQAAETYLFAEGNVTSAGGIATAASIAPVEAMHASVLLFILGQYPVPDAFLGTNKAANVDILTV
jgi:Ferritin-like domain